MAAEAKVTAATTFSIKMGGAETDGMFQSISGISSTIDTVSHDSLHQGKAIKARIPGAIQSFGDIVITRAFNDGKAIYEWHRTIMEKGLTGQLKDMTVEFLDDEKKAVATWNIVQAWPSAHDVAGVAGGSDSALTENWVFTAERIERK